MGWNSQPTSAIILDNVVIPETNMIGKEGDGFKIAMRGLDGGRLNISSCSLGAAQASLMDAIQYTKDREQFGRSISSFQSVQFKLAEMLMYLHASRLHVRQAAQIYDEQSGGGMSSAVTAFCAMAKAFSTDKCFWIINEALQLHGGYGYLRDYRVQQFFRDARVHMILEGTNEVMKMIISKAILS